jgi:hypothetical protein
MVITIGPAVNSVTPRRNAQLEETVLNTAGRAALPPPRVAEGSPRRAVASNLAVNLGAPLAVFYGLRAAGIDQWSALTLSLVPPGLRAVWMLFTRRRIDALAAFTLSILVISVALSFTTGSPRLLLARDGWLTAAVGLWVLLTLLRTPLYFQAVRSFTTGALRERAESAWRTAPRFRRVMRVATAIWGLGLVLDAGLRVVLAYTLPIDDVPLVSALQYIVVFAALEGSSQLYVRRAGGRYLAESSVRNGGEVRP